MGTNAEFKLVPLNEIKVPKDRHRRVLGDIGELADSIKRIGLLHPIVVTNNHDLVVGERRFRAYQWLVSTVPKAEAHFYEEIPVHYLEELDPFERRRVEYEENLKRKDLTWQEDALACLGYYELMRSHLSEITNEEIASTIGMNAKSFRNRCSVATAMKGGDKEVLSCETLGAAWNILERRRLRAIDSEVDVLMSADMSVDVGDTEIDLSKMDEVSCDESSVEDGDPYIDTSSEHIDHKGLVYYGTKKKPYRKAQLDVECTDFNDWVTSYDGPKFNFIHCDFPYGIGVDTSDQMGSQRHTTYEDTPEIFWRLTDSLLNHRDQLMAENCHLMFWFPMQNYEDIRRRFASAGLTVNPYPLVWAKEDKKGVLPDPRRGPRRCYETAFLMTRGERPIIKAVANLAIEPTPQKVLHYSVKPDIMMRQFLRMLVDQSTVMLDPSCGSGVAIRIAEELDARYVHGLDIDHENVVVACRRLNELRLARALPDWEAMGKEGDDG